MTKLIYFGFILSDVLWNKNFFLIIKMITGEVVERMDFNGLG